MSRQVTPAANNKILSFPRTKFWVEIFVYNVLEALTIDTPLKTSFSLEKAHFIN